VPHPGARWAIDRRAREGDPGPSFVLLPLVHRPDVFERLIQLANKSTSNTAATVKFVEEQQVVEVFSPDYRLVFQNGYHRSIDSLLA
jgi:hypothetical protein